MNLPLPRVFNRIACLALLVFVPANFAAEDKRPVASPAGQPAASGVEQPDGAATNPNTLSDKEKTDGWKLLFDGKTLDGWRTYKKQEASGWEVKDGAIVRTTGGDLITKEKYGSFELSIDYKIAPQGNSGLVFHVTEEGEKPWNSGPEVQIQDNAGAHDAQLAGWLYQLYQPPIDPKTGKPIDATHPAGEWNTLKLTIKGMHLETHMNGVKYVECELWSDEWNARVAKTKFSKFPFFGKAKTGFINLQDHRSEVAFRNIKIRPLDEK